jgi:hypothetical protein
MDALARKFAAIRDIKEKVGRCVDADSPAGHGNARKISFA